MSLKGDARSRAPSSGAQVILRQLSNYVRHAGLLFAGFVLLHLAIEAFRAVHDDALPAPGLEVRPAVVMSALVVVWLPFLVFAWQRFSPGASSSMGSSEPPTDKARALAVLERITLVIVLLFTVQHVARVVWPLLSGTFEPSDVRPELVAALSTTEHGVPLLAAAYLCGVGAAAFFGCRQALGALGVSAKRSHARALILLGVLAYVLGSYAVIRTAGGVIWR